MFYVTKGNGEKKNSHKIKNSAFGYIGWKMGDSVCALNERERSSKPVSALGGHGTWR